MDIVTQALLEYGTRCIRAVIFDFDGTLTRASGLDLTAVKKSLDCPVTKPLLEYIETLPAGKRRRAYARLAEHEMHAARRAVPNEGAQTLLHDLRKKGMPFAILTRNHEQAVRRALENFPRLAYEDFGVVLTRDDLRLPKPGPEGVARIARRLGVAAPEILVVGDFLFDIQAGEAAGALTALLDPHGDARVSDVRSDFRVHTLSELAPLIELLRPLPMGKFPNHWLERFFQDRELRDPALIVAPGVGDDTAAVDIQDEAVLVLKSDPITFATDNMGYYAVLVNANDLATAGAQPRWFLATLLFPVGFSAAQILQVMQQLDEVCRRWQITLCGGHTELTDAVCRPVISGMLTGTVAHTDLIQKRRMRPGDTILLTKSIGLEGAAIISGTHRELLRAKGLTESEIDRLHALDQMLSILPEARVATHHQGVSALHDVTEGGLATALEELSVAGVCRLQIDLALIPVQDLVQKMTRLLNLDPLGLIGSGALIIACRPETTAALMTEVEAADIPITVIGTVVEGPVGIAAHAEGRPAKWPKFEADELTRLYN